MKDYEWFEYEMTVNGLAELLVGSHVEAASSKHPYNIVFVPDEESGKFDIYLVGKKDGVFSEYVCWVSDEFVDDPELIYTAAEYALKAFKGPKNVEENLKEINPDLIFHDYPKEDHKEIYDAMRRK